MTINFHIQPLYLMLAPVFLVALIILGFGVAGFRGDQNSLRRAMFSVFLSAVFALFCITYFGGMYMRNYWDAHLEENGFKNHQCK